TPFNKTEKITQGDYELTYTYGPDNQRRKSELKNTSTGITEKEIIYSGSYEKITVGSDIYEVHYIAGGSGLTAIYVIPPSGGQGALYYVYTDHLGSILTLTDATGAIIYEQNFDAWGRNRNPNDWSYDLSAYTPPLGGIGGVWLIRGFTGHEHLPEFALINMNGRVYDPLLGRFNSPDNYVQDPYGTQGYNRYTYAGNNPLVYVDPDGELAWFIPVIIGAVAGYYLGSSIYLDNYNIFSSSWWRGQEQGAWKAGVVGGIFGAGLGLGISAGLAAAGVNITGIAASGAAGASSFASAPTASWYITSNALITGNISMASTALQGGDLDRVYKSGLIGVGAGAAGATVGYYANYGTLGNPVRNNLSSITFPTPKYNNVGRISTRALRLQVGVAGTLIGGFEAGIKSYEQGKRGGELVEDIGLGASIGLSYSVLGSSLSQAFLGLNSPYINPPFSLIPISLMINWGKQ
ncbi:MAG: hypothetical protein HYY40_10745, partial [Bacteroidetes bacterium]|nr:hypothetical protein [Bacteroidota bacterium]